MRGVVIHLAGVVWKDNPNDVEIPGVRADIRIKLPGQLVTPLLLARRIQLVNISPEEAQKYITQQSLDLRYAAKLGEHPLGYTRNVQDPALATFYYNGRAIDNPEDYVEEEYEAKQFHGQDGLGRAMFGYSDHNQARLEARNANGEVRGSYQYVNPLGEDIIVQYWSDGLGFHQIDNRPEVRLQPVTETPEVRAARLAHMKAWEEAASLARANPDFTSTGAGDEPYRAVQANTVEEDPEQDEILAAVSNQHQSLIRYPSLPYTDHISPNVASDGLQDEGVVVEAVARSVKKRDNEQGSEDEPVSADPKGFFYSFDYPVQLVAESAAKKAARAGFGESPQESVVVETKTSNVPKVAPEDDRVSLKAVLRGETLVDAVHDAQVSPKQKLQLERN
uniref:Cuticle protein 6 n=1 Tax=Anopheles culicifacies TaxID=139723 RepID=A0A182MF24_9DIPT